MQLAFANACNRMQGHCWPIPCAPCMSCLRMRSPRLPPSAPSRGRSTPPAKWPWPPGRAGSPRRARAHRAPRRTAATQGAQGAEGGGARTVLGARPACRQAMLPITTAEAATLHAGHCGQRAQVGSARRKTGAECVTMHSSRKGVGSAPYLACSSGGGAMEVVPPVSWSSACQVETCREGKQGGKPEPVSTCTRSQFQVAPAATLPAPGIPRTHTKHLHQGVGHGHGDGRPDRSSHGLDGRLGRHGAALCVAVACAAKAWAGNRYTARRWLAGVA